MGKDTAKNTKIIALLSNLRSRATGTGSQKKKKEHDIPSHILKTIFGLHASVIC